MTQFSVSQVLEAGQKAEFEKKLDYAFQFYKHITDHHGQAPEAQAARDGLLGFGGEAHGLGALLAFLCIDAGRGECRETQHGSN